MRETWVWSLGWEDPLGKGMATRSGILAQRKWKRVSLSRDIQPCPILFNPMDCSLPGSSVYGILQARILEWVAFPFSRGSSHPGIKPRSPALQADFFYQLRNGRSPRILEGSLSLLQWIFPTQELTWGLLHCRRILYQLSYEGSLL